MDAEVLSNIDLKNLSDAKVLIVDDNKHNQELFSKFLGVLDISAIKCADDGLSGIELMTQEDFDLIILDVVMPNMNGEEFLYKIRQFPQFKHVPVIVQTGDNTTEAKEKMFKAGATDFVAKPVSPLEFFSRVRVHLENKMLIKKLNKQVEKMSYNMSLVRKMQQSLFPDKMKVESIGNIYGLKIDYAFEICEKIGGDFWDIIKIDDHNLMFILGDVSGFGIPTSMNVFRVMNFIAETSIPKDKDMGKFVSDINDKLQPTLLRGQYVAMLCLWIDLENNKIHYANAGYQSPLLKEASGNISVFSQKATPLGMTKTSYVSTTNDFNKGDVLGFYGNTIINGKNKNGEALGIDGLKKALIAYPSLVDFLEGFKKDSADIDEDDFAAVILKRL